MNAFRVARTEKLLLFLSPEEKAALRRRVTERVDAGERDVNMNDVIREALREQGVLES